MICVNTERMYEPYSRMVFAQCFLTDGESIIEQMGSLFVFVLIPAIMRGRDSTMY